MEYSNALAHFDRLYATVTKEELVAFDEIVANRSEFLIYINLSRRVERSRTPLSEPPAEHADQLAKQGLRWMSAIARVEVGSMIAAFSTEKAPFAATRPQPTDAKEFISVLLDAARTHYWSLKNDPNLEKLASDSPTNPSVLSYTRRLTMVQAMLNALQRFAGKQMNAAEATTLVEWQRFVDDVQTLYVGNIFAFLGSGSQESTSSTTKSRYQMACYRAIRAYGRNGGKVISVAGRDN